MPSEPSRQPSPVDALRAADVSNLVMRVMAEYTGRGPTRARTHISGDLVSVVLRDTLTRGERRLVQEGRPELVLTTRKALQASMRDELVAGVQELLGREVVAFLSDHNVDPDVAITSFVLASEHPRRRP